MSAYADFDPEASALRSKSDKLKSDVSAFADDAMNRLEVAKEKGLDLANISSRKAAELVRAGASQARRKPVATGLIAAGIGVGLVFLFSKTARSGAVSAGKSVWNLLGR